MTEKKMTRRKAMQTVGALSAALGGKATRALRAGELRWDVATAEPSGSAPHRILLSQVAIAVDESEPSCIHHAVADLAEYLKEISGVQVPILSQLVADAPCLMVVGGALGRQFDSAALESRGLGNEGFRITAELPQGRTRLLVEGITPQGTNFGLATLMGMIRSEGSSACIECPAEFRSKPRFALRGIHLNGWPIHHPYGFRAWSERDWQRFIDIVWLQRGNLFFLWPSIEILPMPLSGEDRAYLEEVRRVVDYAQRRRGMAVWVMHSANRIGIADCGVRAPKLRPYWVNECQKDMNPAEPAQFARIMQSLEAFYRIVNNADGYAMIDSDPGGWPQSPLRDQLRIFKGARALLDRHHEKGARARLIDWMWVGWGRHKFFASEETVVAHYDWTEKNPDDSDVAFQGETIRNFQSGLAEPWGLIAGFPRYLEACRREGVLAKTVFLPYGAIEYEPSFPFTNAGLQPVRGALEFVEQFPETQGVMGNNQTPLVQFPRTYFLLRAAWDADYRARDDRAVWGDLAEALYPDRKDLIVECFAQLEGTDPEAIEAVSSRLEKMLGQDKPPRPGALGRKLFPDHLAVARNLLFQLGIRARRERLLRIRVGKDTPAECAALVENYFAALLAWSRETGWEKMIRIGIWRSPLYATDRRLTETLSVLKRILGEGARVTPYATVAAFFDGVARRLREKFDEDAVMVGCVEPLRLAVIQAP